MDVIGKFLLVVVLVQLIYLLGLLTACWIQRLPIRRIEIFSWGPALFRGKVGQVDLQVGFVPISMSVNIVGMREDEVEIPGSFATRSRIGRAAVHLTSVLLLVLVGMLFLGPSSAMASIGSGVRQVLLGAWAPLSEGKPLVLRFFDRLDHGPLWIAIGVLSVKYAALCLIPAPLQNLFRAILELSLPGRRVPQVGTKLVWFGIAFGLWIGISWMVAVIAATFQHLTGRQLSTWVVIAIAVALLALASLSRSTTVSESEEG